MTIETIYPATSPEFIRGFTNKCASEGLAVSQIEDLLDLELTRQCVQRHGPELIKMATGVGVIARRRAAGVYNNAVPPVGTPAGIPTNAGIPTGIPRGVPFGTPAPAKLSWGRRMRPKGKAALLMGAGAALAGGINWLRGGQSNAGNYGTLPYVPGGYGGQSYIPSNTNGVDPLGGFGLTNSAFPNSSTPSGGASPTRALMGGGMKAQLEAVNTAISDATDPLQKARLTLTQRQLQAQQASAFSALNEFKNDDDYRDLETAFGGGAAAVPTLRRGSMSYWQRAFTPDSWKWWSDNPGKYLEDYQDSLNKLAPKMDAVNRAEAYYGKK